MEGEEYDEDDEEKGLEQGLVYLADGFRDVSRDVERDVIAYSFRKVFTYFFHGFHHVLGHFHGIRAGEHVDAEYGGILSVQSTLRVVGAGFQRYPGHVAQTDDGTVGICPYDNFFKFVHGGETPRGRDGDGDVRSAHRLLAEHSGRGFPVLVFQYVLQVFDR